MAAIGMTLRRPFVRTLPFSGRSLRAASSFKAADLTVERSTNHAPKPDPSALLFGKHFTDHMLTIPWSEERGWEAPQIKPFQNLSLHPAASALHYSVELFEGMKAYRGVDQHVRLFRPMLNMERMRRSADRSCLPAFDKGELLECIRKLVQVDQEWVPSAPDASLYIRPTFIGTGDSLGVSRPRDALLYVIAGPVGPYFATGSAAVSLLADPAFVRAWEGGVGAYKLGGNYGPTIALQSKAVEQGCQQVLWLHGAQEEITEVGTMNLFIYWTSETGEKELLTPPLDGGIILPGITRQSLLDLARMWGEFNVAERKIGMKELLGALDSGRVLEVFGAGTACVVCPVSSLLYKGKTYHIPTTQNGPDLAKKFHKELSDIQYGRKHSDWAPLVV